MDKGEVMEQGLALTTIVLTLPLRVIFSSRALINYHLIGILYAQVSFRLFITKPLITMIITKPIPTHNISLNTKTDLFILEVHSDNKKMKFFSFFRII